MRLAGFLAPVPDGPAFLHPLWREPSADDLFLHRIGDADEIIAFTPIDRSQADASGLFVKKPSSLSKSANLGARAPLAFRFVDGSVVCGLPPVLFPRLRDALPDLKDRPLLQFDVLLQLQDEEQLDEALDTGFDFIKKRYTAEMAGEWRQEALSRLHWLRHRPSLGRPSGHPGMTIIDRSYLEGLAAVSPNRVRDFLRGGLPDCRLLLDETVLPRLELAEQGLAAVDRHRAVLLTGAAGVGKTTALLQIGLKLLARGPWSQALWIDSDRAVPIALLKKSSDPLLLLVDQADRCRFLPKLLAYMERYRGQRGDRLIGTARLGEWRRARFHWKSGVSQPHRLQAGPLDDSAIRQLVEPIVTFAATETPINVDAAAERLRRADARDLLTAMILATRGKPLDDILRDLIARLLKRDDGPKLVALLGAVAGLEIRQTWDGRSQPATLTLLRESFRYTSTSLNWAMAGLDGELTLVRQNRRTRRDEEFIFQEVRCRHPIIASTLWRLLTMGPEAPLDPVALDEALFKGAARACGCGRLGIQEETFISNLQEFRANGWLEEATCQLFSLTPDRSSCDFWMTQFWDNYEGKRQDSGLLKEQSSASCSYASKKDNGEKYRLVYALSTKSQKGKDMNILQSIVSMASAARREGQPAQSGIMDGLLDGINTLLEGYQDPDPTRVWTLHKVDGVHVHLHDSSLRRREPPVNISEGLIGEVIKNGINFKVYPNAPSHKSYKEGWPNTKSEMIHLIRDAGGECIGVINIESDYNLDFFSRHDELDEFVVNERNKRLQDVVQMAADILSPVLQVNSCKELVENGADLLEELHVLFRDQFFQLSVNNLFHWLSLRTNIYAAGFYISSGVAGQAGSDKNGNNTKGQNQACCYNLIAQRSTTQYLPDDRILSPRLPDIVRGKCDLSDYNYPTVYDKSQMQNLFGDSFDQFFDQRPAPSQAYFVSERILMDLGFGGTVLLIIIPHNRERERFKPQSCLNFFKILKAFYTINLRGKALTTYQEIDEKITKVLIASQEEGLELQPALDDVATEIADITSSNFCLIYLESPEGKREAEQTFFSTVGSGPGTVEFAKIMIPKESLLGDAFKTKTMRTYVPNLLEEGVNVSLRAREWLVNNGLKKPEAFIRLFHYGGPKKPPAGAIVLVRDNEMEWLVRPRTVQKILDSCASPVANIYISKTRKILNRSLFGTYQAFFKHYPKLVKGDNFNDKLKSFYNITNDLLGSSLKEIAGSSVFVVYWWDSGNFQIHPSLFDGVEPELKKEGAPTFVYNKGLTGKVIKYSPFPDPYLFVPFVDMYDEGDESTKKHLADSSLEPSSECRLYWDGMFGSRERFFIGVHKRLKRDFLLLVIGKRNRSSEKPVFNPALAREVLRNLLENISNQFTVVFESMVDQIPKDENDSNVLLSEILKDSGLRREDLDRIRLAFDQINVDQQGEFGKELWQKVETAIGSKKHTVGLVQWVAKMLL